MKQVILFFIVAIFLVTPLSFSVSAEEIYDSLQLSPQELELVCNEGETVVKLYSSGFMDAFSEKQTIETILSKDSEFHEIYMVYSENSLQFKHFYKGTLATITQTIYLPEWANFVSFACSPEKIFDSSVHVQRVYCLDGEHSHDGVYIYYVTDQGDYILYKEYLSAEKEYLFPLADFHEFAKLEWEDRIKHAYEDGGGTPIEELMMEIQSPNVQPADEVYDAPYLVIALATIITAGGVVTYVVIKRRRRRLETEEPNAMP